MQRWLQDLATLFDVLLFIHHTTPVGFCICNLCLWCYLVVRPAWFGSICFLHALSENTSSWHDIPVRWCPNIVAAAPSKLSPPLDTCRNLSSKKQKRGSRTTPLGTASGYTAADSSSALAGLFFRTVPAGSRQQGAWRLGSVQARFGLTMEIENA